MCHLKQNFKSLLIKFITATFAKAYFSGVERWEIFLRNFFIGVSSDIGKDFYSCAVSSTVISLFMGKVRKYELKLR